MIKTPDIEILASEDFELRQPKILLFDIETAPNLSYVWGHYEQNVLAHVTERYMICWAAKWFNGKTTVKALPDYDNYKAGSEDDKQLVIDLWNLFNEADVIIGHNGDSFDIKWANTRFLLHGLEIPAPYKTVDTLKVARRYFKFNSNKLNDLGKTLGVGQKVQHTGFALWQGCLQGDEKSWKMMRRYNRQDVTLLEKVYIKLRPWMTNHPNIAVMSDIEKGCRVCGGTELIKSGWNYTATGRRKDYRCKGCGAHNYGSHEARTKIR